jgi:hypothetical protein
MKQEQENDAGQAAAAAEAEAALRSENEALGRELELKQAAIARLEQALAEETAGLAAQQQALAEAERKLAELGGHLSQAVAAYREMVVQANPGVLAELITGETVESVNEALKTARALVDRVRQEVEAEASRTRVPAGAPQRMPPDVSGLSPREKIQYAIGGSA